MYCASDGEEKKNKFSYLEMALTALHEQRD